MKSRRASSKKGSVVRAFKTICWMGNSSWCQSTGSNLSQHGQVIECIARYMSKPFKP